MADRSDRDDRSYRYRHDSSSRLTRDDHATGLADGERSMHENREMSHEDGDVQVRRDDFVKLIGLAVLAFLLVGAVFAALGSVLVYAYVKANDPDAGYWSAVSTNWHLVGVIAFLGGLYSTSFVRLVKKPDGAYSNHLWRQMVPRNRRNPWR